MTINNLRFGTFLEIPGSEEDHIQEKNYSFMKPNLYAALFILITGISLSAGAQTTYPITANVSTSSFGSGVICTNCNIVISPGITVTINNTCSCNNCTFTGGTVAIVPGSNFTLTGVDSFKNQTVLISQSFNMSTLAFYGDTVAFNAAMNLSGGRTDIDSSRVSVNAPLTLKSGTFYKDSLHLNKNLTFTNGIDSFAYSNIRVASGAKITAGQSNFINSTLNFAGSSSMSVANGMTSTGSNYYLGGTSTISSTNATTLSGDKIVMSGTTNSFSTTFALATTNTDITLKSTSSSTLSAQSLTASGGSITAATGSTISSTNAISLTNTNTALTGTTFKGQSLTTSGGSFNATGGSVKSTFAVSLTNTTSAFNSSVLTGQSLTTSGGTLSLSSTSPAIQFADNFTGTDVTMSGNSVLSGGSGSFSSGSSLTMSGTASISVTNAFDVSGSDAYLNGNNSISSGSMAISGGSFLKIGDGSLANTAKVSVSGTFSVDNSSLLGIANNNNYLSTTNNSLKTNTISCGGGGTQHSCATGFVYGCGTIKNNVGAGCVLLALADLNLSTSIAGPTQVAISWTDGATPAADHYDVQRNTGNNWNTITTITAGTYATGEYHFTDADAPSGTVQYRIIRVDENGTTTYSSISTVTLALINAPVSIHPNPATGGTFYITTTSTGEIIVNVFTMTGQLLLRTVLKGSTQYPIHLPLQTQSLGSVVVQTIGQTGTWATTVLVR